MLKKTDNFEIHKNETGKTVLTLAKKQLEIKSVGGYIELQVSYLNRFLLFISDDITYEQSLWIYLIDNNLEVLDCASIFYPYANDQFELVKIVQPNVMYFDFLLKDKIWQIEILPKPVWALTNPFAIPKRKNGILSKLYFKLNKISDSK